MTTFKKRFVLGYGSRVNIFSLIKSYMNLFQKYCNLLIRTYPKNLSEINNRQRRVHIITSNKFKIPLFWTLIQSYSVQYNLRNLILKKECTQYFFLKVHNCILKTELYHKLVCNIRNQVVAMLYTWEFIFSIYDVLLSISHFTILSKNTLVDQLYLWVYTPGNVNFAEVLRLFCLSILETIKPSYRSLFSDIIRK